MTTSPKKNSDANFTQATHNDEVFFEIDSNTTDIKQTLLDLVHDPIKKIKLVGDKMKEHDVKAILDCLKEREFGFFSITIDLPEHLQQTKIQIELDNILSNNSLIHKQQQIQGSISSSDSQIIQETPKGRIKPKKVKPKIEITLYEEAPSAHLREPEIIVHPKTTAPLLAKPAKLERLPIAESILTELLSHNVFQDEKKTWEQISTRSEALEFRKNFPIKPINPIENHPIFYLVSKHDELKNKLTQWTKKLGFDLPQYNALLDVVGQYGVTGLEYLFQTWEYNNDPNKIAAFEETYTLILKHMPSYIPFIQNSAFNDVISKIANFSEEKRSWWNTLIKNHLQSTQEYTDLVYLFRVFTESAVEIEEMGLPFFKTELIKTPQDLPSTLSSMISLLKKCPDQDKEIQWKSIDKVDVSIEEDVHFNIPEMKLGEHISNLEEIKAKMEPSSKLEPELIKPGFYRYLAHQKQHLPLKKYEELLSEIFSNPALSVENKLRMIYVLAKTTSTDKNSGYDANHVYEEWVSFQTRTIKLEYMERIKANRTEFGRFALTRGIEATGGYPGVRNTLLRPIIEMPSIPPMNYLNKLLTLSEYKFLDPNLSITEMQTVQNGMMIQMKKAAELYAVHPDIMSKAISLIKTETIKANAQGKYIPEKNDIELLEKFVNSSELFIDSKHNTLSKEEINPKQVLLPLLTTFHLEYESKQSLEDLITQYKKRVTGFTNPGYKEIIENSLPYALSLLQLIKDREQPKKLDIQALDTIQGELLEFLCTPNTPSKKQIREWLHGHYGSHFEGNTLLDIKDDVNFDELFKQRNVVEPKIKNNIETLVSYFDEDDEKGYHTELANDLIELTSNLTDLQNVKFFEFCKDALKTSGQFSRAKQSTPPSFIQQFRTLIQTLTECKDVAALEQYLILAQENTSSGKESNNHLIKLNYLIKTLFPILLNKNIERKEAFNFAAKLVCQSPQDALFTSHRELNFSHGIDFTNSDLNELKNDIYNFTPESPPEELYAIGKRIDAILSLAPDDAQCFTQCRRIKVLIEQIKTSKENQIIEHNNQTRLTKILYSIKNFFTPYVPEITTEEYISLSNEKIYHLGDITQAELNNLMLKRTTRFENAVTHLHDKKEELISKYTNITTRINDFIIKALSLSPDNISKNHNELCKLIDELISLDDQNSVLSLMYHFAGGLPNREVADLVELFNTDNYQSLSNALKKDFINVILSQMNNNVNCGKEEIHNFLSYISDNKENQLLVNCLHIYYQQAPYPSLDQFVSWTQILKTQTELDTAYDEFDKNPCALPNGHNGRERENGFIYSDATRIVSKMPEVNELFTTDYLSKLEGEWAKAKLLSTSDILQQLKDYKETEYDNHRSLVAMTCELLHRCKGRAPEFVGSVQVPGRSFELNTTQILAVLAMLESGKKVTAEIGTGEGKTRILMVINACQFLKGNTVDFLTSNLALAERDYLESLPFFKSLGAQVNYITASSKIEDYKIDGINVSDPANIFLFRKKGLTQNLKDLVLNPKEKKRALTLDEADVTFFDVANTKYNFAYKTPRLNIELVSLYPLLMEFFAQSNTEKTYLENKKRCNEQLVDFIETRNLELFNHVRNGNIRVEQLEKLQDAAYTARHLEYNIDYTVVSEATIPTDLGSKKVAAAMCLIGGRINENAKFSEGVHACLHAELNRLMRAPASEIENPYLKEILEKCKHKERLFHIDPERQIASTTSSNTMLKDYNKGNLMAVTGTVGTELEQKEAKDHFKTNFITIPRHKGLHRYDRPIIICNNNHSYIETFVTSILEARSKNQPTLIICKDDNHSREIYEALNNRLESKKDATGMPKITRIHAATDFEDGVSEAKYIKNEAGKPGQVTISTEMQGRGVDIIPGPEGLRVLHAYLPKDERDYIQGIGRSGRFGQVGTSQMILTIETLKNDFGIDYLNSDFYLNPEAFIRRLQIFSTITKKLHRLFYKSFDDLLGLYTAEYEQKVHRDEKSAEAWSHFIEQMNFSQENAQQAIEAELQKKEPNINEIETKLTEHSTKAANLWHAFIESQPEKTQSLIKKDLAPEITKPAELNAWLKAMKELQAKNIYQVDVTEKRKVKIHEQYSAATAGRMSILKYPATFIPNFLSWWRGEDILFPNLQAWWKGDLSFREFSFGFIADFKSWWKGEGFLFPNERAWVTGNLSFRNMISQWPIFRYFISPVEETHDVKITIPSIYAYFYKNKELTRSDSSDEDVDLDLQAPKNYAPLFANTDDDERIEVEPTPSVLNEGNLV